MTVGWVAATTRGRSLLGRMLGVEGARAIATTSSWAEGRNRVALSIYGSGLAANADRETARRTATAAAAWQLRVLSGWLPPDDGGLARLAAAPMEIANIEAHLVRLGGGGAETIPIGTLGVVWPRISSTTSVEQVRSVLSRSAWGDPGGTDRSALAVGLRVAWARRLALVVPSAREWALGTVALLIARERLVFERQINEITARELDRLVDHHWRAATTVGELAESLPRAARWSLDGIDSPIGVWKAETAILRRVVEDARHRAVSGRHDRETMADILALVLVDLWRVTAAIEGSGRGSAATEVFDAVA
jgi:hypothetical protein